MLLNSSQLQSFSKSEEENFIRNSLTFIHKELSSLVHWANEEEARLFIRSIIDFSLAYEIRSELNIQKLMYYKLRFNFHIPLAKNHERLLSDKINPNENVRLKRFFEALLQENSDN